MILIAKGPVIIYRLVGRRIFEWGSLGFEKSGRGGGVSHNLQALREGGGSFLFPSFLLLFSISTTCSMNFQWNTA